MQFTVNRGVRAALLAGAALIPLAPAWAQVTADSVAANPPAQDPAVAATDEAVQNGDIVVTGQTSRNRPLITASADITYANREAIDRKAARSTAELLELVPGIFVEGTAGPVSNNYSVRGLQGGNQRFVQLEEDGMPILYGGGGADFFFDQDLTIDRLEAVKGGSSGVLTVNGAGATINFVSKRPNFNEAEGAARVSAYNYGWLRGDFYYSQPITEKLAFNVGGYIQSNPGQRENPFDYKGWRVKGQLEYRFDDGGFVRLSAKGGDVENAFYATQPYAFVDGKVRGIPGLGTQFGNVGGDAFNRISVPVSTFVESDGLRDFRYRDGIVAKSAQVRLDINKPVADGVELFGQARYIKYSYDFNGLFPGSGTGNAGLTGATTYLNPARTLNAGGNAANCDDYSYISPIGNLLCRGGQAFPTNARFGVRNLRTGVVLGSNQTAELNALNGNGFLQRTTLNHDYIDGKDFGLNVGGRWEIETDRFKNSLTAGVMYFNVKRDQNQSATASVVNDVRTNSDIYDIVALDASNNVIGTLSDNGLVSYGDWGAGIRERKDESISLYLNDEIQIGDLRVDAGIRWESDRATAFDGNSLPASQPVQPGRGGVIRTVGPAFDGTFSPANATRTGADGRLTQEKVAWTVGANYLVTPDFSIYARYARGFQTNNIDPITTIDLYEAGARFQSGRFFTGSATVFQTNFNNQFFNFADPENPSQQTTLNADLRTRGVEFDLLVRPIEWFSVNFQGVFQDPELRSLALGGVDVSSEFEGNRPERTPARLFTITPVVSLPDGKGEIYGRYKHIGQIFADNGNGLALPSYGVTSAGITYNLSDRLQANFNVDNIFSVVGLTEGNPRQGQTQAVNDGFFYARGIVGTTYGGSITMRF